MKDKNLPNDIQSKSVEELIDLAINIIENLENKKMLDVYLKYVEGSASKEELDNANEQLKEILKSLGLGIMIILPLFLQ